MSQTQPDSLLVVSGFNKSLFWGIRYDSVLSRGLAVDSVAKKDSLANAYFNNQFALRDTLPSLAGWDSLNPYVDNTYYNAFVDSSNTLPVDRNTQFSDSTMRFLQGIPISERIIDSLFPATKINHLNLQALLNDLNGFGQVARNPPVNFNANECRISVVVQGPALVPIYTIQRYYANFYFPLNNATANIEWYVAGGNIVGQNINPNLGPVYVDVQWMPRSSFDLIYGMPKMVLAIDYTSKQMGALFVYYTLADPTSRTVLPNAQDVLYNQIPTKITGYQPNCPVAYTSIVYRWYAFNQATFQTTGWSLIPGENQASYQPPALLYKHMLYKRETIFYSNSGTVEVYRTTSNIVSVNLRTIMGGDISTPNNIIPYGTAPTIVNNLPAEYGGYTLNAITPYTYRWEKKLDNGAGWVSVGTGYAFPTTGITDIKCSIRRVTMVNNPPGSLYDGTHDGYVELYSNILEIFTSYQTVNFENRNYVRVNTINKKGIATWEQADLLSIGTATKNQFTKYFDGLGRNIQTLAAKVLLDKPTQTWLDGVTMFQYGPESKIEKSFLSYTSSLYPQKFKEDAITAQPQFYTNLHNDAFPFAKVEYDNSPLNRVMKVMAPGQSWAGNNVGVTADFQMYNNNENVIEWTIGFAANASPTVKGSYAFNPSVPSYQNNNLIKTIATDEKGKIVVTYTNQRGLTILKKVQLADVLDVTKPYDGWLCTYYVYDDFDQLRYIITPKAVKWLVDNNWQPMPQDVKDGLCYRYEYDERGRLIISKSADKGEEYYVYDNKNRLVFTQDANQRKPVPQQWTVSFYDLFNRTVLSGIYKSNSSRATLQTNLNAQTGSSTITTTTNAPATDLIVPVRDQSIGQYLATTSIDFTDGFESANVDAFETQLNASSTSSTEIVAVDINPLPGVNLTDPNVFQSMVFNYYDNYNYVGAKAFVPSVNFAYQGGDIEPYLKTKRHFGFTTGSRVRVLDDQNATTQFLTSTSYYDQDGMSILGLAENINGGTDYTASQHHFDGRILSVYDFHNNPGNSFYNSFFTLNKYRYDLDNTLIGIGKKVNTNTSTFVASSSVIGSQEDVDANYKLLNKLEYDKLGRVLKKTLAPDFNTVGIETQDISYNIRGWVTGMNKDYVLNPLSNNQFSHFFGFVLGYDNADNLFATPQFNGKISGNMWRSSGDGAQRKYDYTYDNAGRFTQANFFEKEKWTDSWNKAKHDFTVENVLYDENGNLLSMTQWGVLPGAPNPIKVDQLTYSYKANSNLLLRVNDAAATGANNGKLGDFKDGLNTGDDYVYDDNGNLIGDKNKGIETATGDAIVYNVIDKPCLINIKDKGNIRFVYDATGAKLQKVTTENQPNGTTNITITKYIGNYTYVNNELVTIAHEEGRIRLITPLQNAADPTNYDYGGIPMPNNQQGVFDYDVKDHLGNIRAIVTEELKQDHGICTMETALPAVATQEEAQFGNLPPNNEVANTRDNKPPDWTAFATNPNGSANLKVSKLVSTTGVPKVGPNTLLKVMAGDKLSARVNYFYRVNPGQSPLTNQGIAGLLTGLTGALGGNNVNSIVKGNTTQVTTQLTNNTYLGDFLNNQGQSSPNLDAPKAYLNYLFFDDQLNFVSQSSGFARVTMAGNGTDRQLIVTNVQAPRNGFVYVYLSNESAEPVYFDDLEVTHTRGRLIEEDHYYAYGLKIGALCSKANNNSVKKDLPQKGYQGIFAEEEDDLDLNLNEFFLRDYDPQIGRWWQNDPYEEFPSPYVGMGCDPVKNVDEDGGSIGPGVEWAKIGETLRNLNFAANALSEIGPAGAFATITKSTTTIITSVASKTISAAGKIAKHLTPVRDNGWFQGRRPTVTMLYDKTFETDWPGKNRVPYTLPTLDDLNKSSTPQPIEKEKESVGQPGFGESLIPVWGSGRAAVDDFQNGRWGWGIFNTVMAISDVFLLKTAFTAVGKFFVKAGGNLFTKEATKEVVYKLITVGGKKYIGQTKNFLKRLIQHFGKKGRLTGQQLEKALLYEMKGSSKLEREVYEQYLIDKEGLENLINIVNPMGGRRDLFNKMIDLVIEKFNLPR